MTPQHAADDRPNGGEQAVDDDDDLYDHATVWPGPNWTQNEAGRENSSPEFLRLVAHVEQIIRNGAHDLIAGRAETVARTIMANLAHRHGLAPQDNARGES